MDCSFSHAGCYGDPDRGLYWCRYGCTDFDARGNPMRGECREGHQCVDTRVDSRHRYVCVPDI
ncbi:MAG: hypothetical protein SangKO_019620 [Sandaracinaceae bacterium]